MDLTIHMQQETIQDEGDVSESVRISSEEIYHMFPRSVGRSILDYFASRECMQLDQNADNCSVFRSCSEEIAESAPVIRLTVRDRLDPHLSTRLYFA